MKNSTLQSPKKSTNYKTTQGLVCFDSEGKIIEISPQARAIFNATEGMNFINYLESILSTKDLNYYWHSKNILKKLINNETIVSEQMHINNCMIIQISNYPLFSKGDYSPPVNVAFVLQT